MYFLWKQTPYGMIKISGDGLADFVNDSLKSRFKLCGLSFSLSKRKKDADLILVLSSENILPEIKNKVENHLSLIMKPMGIASSIIWSNPEKDNYAFIQSPWTWGTLASSAVVIFTAGWENFFWTAFWGAAAWFIARGFSQLGILFEKRSRRSS